MPIYRKAAEQDIATFCMKTSKHALWCNSFIYYDIFTVREALVTLKAEVCGAHMRKVHLLHYNF